MVKRIAYITDTHLNEQYPIDLGVDSSRNLEIIINDIKLRKIDEIIFGGDIGAPSSYDYFFDSLSKYGTNLKLIPGNHDHQIDFREYYFKYILKERKELFYCNEDNYFKYFFLDSSADIISSPQLLWFEKELQSSQNKKIIFVHHPILKVNTPIDKEFPLKNRQTVKDILIKHKQEIVIFCGHYHMDDFTEDYNTRQYISPAASYQAIKESDSLELKTDIFGYRIITFENDRFKTEVILFNK